MVQTIYCKYCGGCSIPLKQTYVNVSFITSENCDRCRRSHDESTTEFFCSVKCFESFYEAKFLKKYVREKKP